VLRHLLQLFVLLEKIVVNAALPLEAAYGFISFTCFYFAFIYFCPLFCLQITPTFCLDFARFLIPRHSFLVLSGPNSTRLGQSVILSCVNRVLCPTPRIIGRFRDKWCLRGLFSIWDKLMQFSMMARQKQLGQRPCKSCTVKFSGRISQMSEWIFEL